MPKKSSFLRTLGLLEVVGIGVGSTLGPTIFVILGLAAGMAGPAVIVSFILGGLLTFVIAFNYAELATALPLSGGGYTFCKEAFAEPVGKPIAFVTGWLMWIGYSFYSAFAAVSFSYMLVTYIPVHPSIISSLTIAVFMAINLRSGKESGKIQLILTIFLSVVLATFIVAALPQINLETVTSSFMPKGIIGVFEATAFLFVAYIGFEAIATVGGEIRNPEKVIPLASFISVALCSLIYVLVGFASLGVVNWAVLKESATPLALVAQATLGRYGEYLVIIGGIVATLTTVSASLLASTRVLYALSRDGFLPEALHKMHPRYNTPFNAIIASSLFIMLFAATGVVEFVVGVANFGFQLGLSLVNLSVIFLRRKGLKRSFETPFYPYMPILGFLVCLTISLFLKKDVLIAGTIAIVVGVIIYVIIVMKRVIERLLT